MQPKFHYLNHTWLSLLTQSKKRWSLNPIVYSCQMQEDYIGRPSRLSRRCNPRSVSTRVLQRSFAATRQCLRFLVADGSKWCDPFASLDLQKLLLYLKVYGLDSECNHLRCSEHQWNQDQAADGASAKKEAKKWCKSNKPWLSAKTKNRFFCERPWFYWLYEMSDVFYGRKSWWYTYAHICICRYVYIYIYTYMNMHYIYVCIYIYIIYLSVLCMCYVSQFCGYD